MSDILGTAWRAQNPCHAEPEEPRRSILRTTIAALLLSISFFAAADGPQIDAEEWTALSTYKADVERLCPTVAPGGGRLKSCLMEHREEMSVGCAQTLQTLKKRKQTSG